MATRGPRVSAVNVVHEVYTGPIRDTAIDKRPVAGAVHVGELGLAGDVVCDTRNHGGPDRAVYAYASEDADAWAAELGRPITPGLFGENLTTIGVDVNGALIGERWQVGGRDGVVLEVRMPRTPCANLSARLELPGFHRRFAKSGTTGAMLSVVASGSIATGDRIAVTYRPGHGVTVHDIAVDGSDTDWRALLAADLPLARHLDRQARRRIGR